MQRSVAMVLCVRFLSGITTGLPKKDKRKIFNIWFSKTLFQVWAKMEAQLDMNEAPKAANTQEIKLNLIKSTFMKELC